MLYRYTPHFKATVSLTEKINFENKPIFSREFNLKNLSNWRKDAADRWLGGQIVIMFENYYFGYKFQLNSREETL